MPVVFIFAGPGWGKTTLLAQWAARSQRPFAWVTVDERDNDPIVLLTHVAAAVDRVSRLAPGVFEALGSPGASAEGTVVPRLGAALAAVERAARAWSWTTCTCSRTGSCLDAIAALARHVRGGLTAGSSLRGAGRRFRSRAPAGAGAGAAEIEPGRPAHEPRRRRASSWARPEWSCRTRRVAELDRAHGGLGGGPVPGWRCRSGRGGPRRRARPAFSGSDRLVSDYLRSELLAHLSPDDLRFLTRTAVLEWMSAPLCDAVLETERHRRDSGIARALQSVPRGRWTGVGTRTATTTSSRSCSVPNWNEPSRIWCPRSSFVQAHGVRRTSAWRRPSATHRRPGKSTAWHTCSNVRLTSPTKAVVLRPSNAGFSGWTPTARLIETRPSPCSARSTPPPRADRRRRTDGPMSPKARATRGPCPTAALRSTRGSPICVLCAVVEAWQVCAQMPSLRAGRSPVRSPFRLNVSLSLGVCGVDGR